MKYTIMGFQQLRLVELKLDLVDAAILRWIVDFSHSTRIRNIEFNGVRYFWMSYNHILKDMPIITIKKRALRNRLVKLTEAGILESACERNEQGTFTYYRLDAVAYEKLIKSPEENDLNDQREGGAVNAGGLHSNAGGVASNCRGGCIEMQPKDPSTKDPSTKDPIPPYAPQSNSQNKDIEEIYSLYPATSTYERNGAQQKRSTAKSSSCKKKILNVLKTGYDLKAAIPLYVEERKRSNTPLQNFSTFLNNLPDLDALRESLVQDSDQAKSAQDTGNSKPDKDDFKKFASENDIPMDTAKECWQYYSRLDWHMNGRPVDWRAKLLSWHMRDQKQQREVIRPPQDKWEPPTITHDEVDWEYLDSLKEKFSKRGRGATA